LAFHAVLSSTTSSASRDPLAFTTAHFVIVIVLCALTATMANRALAVFNDGIRPFMLDYRNGGLARRDVAVTAARLAAGFMIGIGGFVGFASGTLNPFLLFLPTDILGILAPRRWLAPVLGAAWGAVALFGLGGAHRASAHLPIDMFGAMHSVLQPIYFLFALFPIIAIGYQCGRRAAIGAFVTCAAVLVAAGQVWSSPVTRWITLSTGMTGLLALACRDELRIRRLARASTESAVPRGTAGAGDAIDDLFREHARRLRANLGWFVLLGAGIALIAQQHMFAGGEVSGFAIRDASYSSAAQLDLFRAFAYVPMIATAALAAGCYGISGLLFVYTLGYLSPNPVVAAAGGAVLYGAEIMLLPLLRRGFDAMPTLRDVSDNVRSAMYLTIETALLVGSVLAGNQMAAGLGMFLVGGVILLNETLGRPILRMASGPTAVVVVGFLLNVLHWMHAVPVLKG
jgi:hypothetical protein